MFIDFAIPPIYHFEQNKKILTILQPLCIYQNIQNIGLWQLVYVYSTYFLNILTVELFFKSFEEYLTAT